MAAVETRFRVMGSTGHVVVVGDDPTRLLAHAETRLRALEDRWTRFAPDSELNRLNRRQGKCTSVHPDTFALVARACDGWRLTDGLFDPTVLAAMVQAGYTRPLDVTGRAGEPDDAGHAPSPGCGSIELDPTELTVTLGAGVTLDPGGIGKGLAADLVVGDLLAMGADGALVNVGGDLSAKGRAPDRRAWSVAVEDPFDADAILATLRLGEGAVATTTPVHRRWRTTAGPARHVIDPRHGRPASTLVASVTVVAAQAWMAETVAKAAAISGVEGALELIDDATLSGLVVSEAGSVGLSARLGAYL